MTEQSIKNKTLRTDRNAVREILLLGIKNDINPEDRERLARLISGTTDFEYLFYLADFHGITPLLAHNLSQTELINLLPETYQERLNGSFQNNVYRNMFLSEELGKLLSVFNQHGIETISIKGIILSEQLYVNPGLRTTTDIDLLVHPERVSQASSLLIEAGYSESTLPEELNHPFHRLFHKKVRFPFIVELHWNLSNPRLVAITQSEIWSRAHSQRFQGGVTAVLSPEDILLYLTNNLLTQDGQQMKYLGDITELLKKHSDNLDWDYIVGLGRSLEITATIYYSFHWAQKLLGVSVPKLVMITLKPTLPRRWLINYLMSHQTLLSPLGWYKIRSEIAVLTRSLMMSRIRQTLAVLAIYRGDNKKTSWLRTVAWIPLVFGTTLWLNMSNLFRR